jgi:thiamine-monophosphate kinase
MIDISDGLVIDLGRVCEESKLGAIIYYDKIPISQDAKRLAKIDRVCPLSHALYDGEDYELLFTVDKDSATKIEKKHLAKSLGIMIKGKGIRITTENGFAKLLKIKGYEHKFAER